MDSLRKSFKSHGSYKHRRHPSSGATPMGSPTSHEELPILSSDHDHHHDIPEVVVVNMSPSPSPNYGSAPVSREPSVHFWRDLEINSDNIGDNHGTTPPEDPPSQLIGQFLNKQRAAGDVSLDMDFEMDDLRQPENHRRMHPVAESAGSQPRNNRSRDMRVSFDQASFKSNNLGSAEIDDSGGGGGGEEKDGKYADEGVVKCSSNAAFQRRSTLLRAKTRSRLMDPPEDQEQWSGRVPKSGAIPKSGPMKSGMLSKGGDDDDDEDTFLDEDLPDDLKMSNFNALTFLQWLGLILMVVVLIVTLKVPSIKKRYIEKLELWKWEVMVWVLICGRLVSGWGIKIIVFLIERNFFLRKRVLYFVYGVRKAVQNSLWLGLVLLAWNLLFDKKVESHAIGLSTYFDRIQESLFNQYVIETLSGPPLIEIQTIEQEKERMEAELRTLQETGATVPSELRAVAFASLNSKRVIGGGGGGGVGLQRSPLVMRSMKLSRALSRKEDQGITIDLLHKLNTKNVSAWKMKRLMNMVKHGVLSTLDEQVVNTTYEDESTNQIRSENEAKVAARRIFLNVAKPGSKYIYIEDVMRFMREDEAWKAMMQFEGAMDRCKISKSNLKNWLVNVFRERRALALTLNDTKTAVNKLHRVINGVVSVIILVIWLLILGIATSKFLMFLSSQLLLVAFVFGNTCKTIFESIIFLFVMHPFDVGDRCEVDGVQMIVEEMDILTTVFLRYDNQKIMYPNSTLSTKSIGNFYRSPDMGDSVEFWIHISTPPEKISAMKQRIISYIENKKEHWCSSPTVILTELKDLNRVKLAVWLRHKMNHQNMGEKWVRRALVVEEMVRIFRELDLQYRMLPLDINVKNMPPMTSTRMPPSWSPN
ncbi:hypothetical protein MLD38_023120 [Melastoma candidum]|uniref:Uncharacterized protein n=1 Tax=Melastoma candidum TaxID=119954 RepID=A0ACB9QNA8_9MYRT|nr:hypothetical protein MLD38_023120 [Melastoma candidum]